MMISAYDGKKEAKFDLEGLEKYFKSLLDHKEHEKRVAIAKEEAYLEGYTEALYAIASIMGASNYRAEESEAEG
jgi:hypothetical protein